jgi:hypothetical protein
MTNSGLRAIMMRSLLLFQIGASGLSALVYAIGPEVPKSDRKTLHVMIIRALTECREPGVTYKAVSFVPASLQASLSYWEGDLLSCTPVLYSCPVLL